MEGLSVWGQVGELLYSARVLARQQHTTEEAIRRYKSLITILKNNTLNTELYDTVIKEARRLVVGVREDLEFADDAAWVRATNIKFHDQIELLSTDFEQRKRY